MFYEPEKEGVCSQKGSFIAYFMSSMKRTVRLIVSKELVRRKHTFGKMHNCIFGTIVPIFICTLMHENRNDILSANRKELVD